ncbi:hypothetical protein [Spiroplasma alleghenense]|uniref:Uncharacterized protein n=1 Tax=Spiroplasma alleghenense TaxID=216931 RepID=A0A345Z2Q6_9MOLU|nr:hypothetical protein [Spiroplasma alleghenense]AXK50885.1 hypothetical protein SALLE_v1c02090 [Spiroplasma alleghenense]
MFKKKNKEKAVSSEKIDDLLHNNSFGGDFFSNNPLGSGLGKNSRNVEVKEEITVNGKKMTGEEYEAYKRKNGDMMQGFDKFRNMDFKDNGNSKYVINGKEVSADEMREYESKMKNRMRDIFED